MTHIDRRRALALVAAVPAAVALGVSAGDENLVHLINRYRAEIAALNASRGLSDDELDAWIDRADEILVEAVKVPVLTMAGAVAVISLHIDEPLLSQHSWYGDEFRALVKSARDHLAAT